MQQRPQILLPGVLGPPLLRIGVEVQGRGRWREGGGRGLSSWIISHGSQALGEGPLD